MAQNRVSMSDMDFGTDPLPQAPAAPRLDLVPPPPEPSAPTPAYVPPTSAREPLVTWSCRLPLRLRNLLEAVARDYDTDMSKIVVDLLEINLPKIPRKRKN